MSETHRLYNQIEEELMKANKILLVAHKRPDGDTLGAVLALYCFLKELGKEVFMFCKDPVPSCFLFLPGAEEIREDVFLFENAPFDCVVLCDSDLECSGAADYIKRFCDPIPTLINIDHHRTNQDDWELKILHEKASSTTEILYDFFSKLNIEINRSVATCLLTGILTDTCGFTNPGTTFESLNVASSLIQKGASYRKINECVQSNKSVHTLQFWGVVLDRLQKNSEFGIATTIILQKDLEEFNLTAEAAEGIANFLNNLGEVKAVLVLRELGNNLIKGSFRTTSPDVDVSRLAELLGGGGHEKAAGFTLEGNLVQNELGWKII